MAILLLLYKFFAKHLTGTNISRNPIARKLISNLNSKLKPEYVLINGKKLFLDENDSLFLSLFSHETMQVSLSKKEIKKGNVVLDIGAHIGYYTIIFSELVGPEGKVYAFEPHPKNFQLLKKTVETNNLTNVEIFQNIVSDKNQSVDFYLSKLDSIGNRMFVSDDADTKIKIDSITIDEFLKNRNGKIDFIKMDIQGAEVLAIDGMKNTLRNNPHLKIIQEWWPTAIQKHGKEPDSHLNFLEKLGFNFYVVDEHSKQLTQITIPKLIETYPNEDLEDVNLFCINEKIN